MVFDMTRLLILVTGMPGSGKSIVVDVARELGIPVYTMGDVIREETIRRYGTITPDLMVQTSKLLREEYGEEIVALRTLDKIPSDQCIVLIDGVRSLIEVEVFKKHGHVVVIAVHASPRTRYRRLLERGRPGDPSTFEDFTKRDLTELNFGLGNVIALADYVIINEGPIEKARLEAKEVLLKLVEMHGRNTR